HHSLPPRRSSDLRLRVESGRRFIGAAYGPTRAERHPHILLDELPAGCQRPMTSVAQHFSNEASYWADAYQLDDLTSRIYQRRLQLTLDWMDRLQLPDGARALDLGAGAG